MTSPTKSCTFPGRTTVPDLTLERKKNEAHVAKNIDGVYQNHVQDKSHEERNSDITVDQMLGRSRELFLVEENDRHEVNVHSKNDKNLVTVAPNFKVTLTQDRGCASCDATPSTNHPDSSEATTGACDSGVQTTVEVPQLPYSVRDMVVYR